MTAFELSQRDLDLAGVDDYYGNQTFMWNGGKYICTIASSSDPATLGIGGIGGDETLQITVRVSQLANGTPSKADIVTVSGTDYEIDKVTMDTAGVFYVFHLTSPNP